MKKNYLLFIILFLFTATAINAKSKNAGRFDWHNVDVYGGVGYSGLLNSNKPYSQFIGGGGGILGAAYEWEYKKFIMAVGPEFRIFSSKDNFLQLDNPYISHLNYANQEAHYTFHKFTENQAVGQIMMPIMAGMNLTSWYFLAGIKPGFTIMDRWHQRSTYDISIFDPAAMDPEWINLHSHGVLNDLILNEKGKNSLGFDLTLSAEAGVYLDEWMPDKWRFINDDKGLPELHYRLGVFIDYGLVNMNISEGLPALAIDDEPAGVPSTSNLAGLIATNSLHRSAWSESRLNSLLVGVKFTTVFQLTRPKGPKKPAPRLVVETYDRDSEKVMGGVKVTVKNDKTGKKTTKPTDGHGQYIKRTNPGNYTITASKANYLETVASVVHQNIDPDTVRIEMVPVPVFKLTVVDAKTNEGIAAVVDFLDAETAQLIRTETANPSTGITTRLNLGQAYRVKISSPDYLVRSFVLDTISKTMQVALDPIEKRVYKIENLFFATNDTIILKESEPSMQELYEFLSDNESVRIRIIGHTDNVGSDAANQKLSEGRARSVRSEMIKRGIDPQRIEWEGRGESEPVATNDTPEGRQLNRRVEFIIL